MTTEEKDRIFSSIQDIVNNNPVIVVGCGASMGFGIPGMWDLAEAIKKIFRNATYIKGISKLHKKTYC